MNAIDWDEYDSAAEWCTKRGFTGMDDEPLPPLLSQAVMDEITNHPEEFWLRVRETAYDLAMSKRDLSA